MSDLIKIEDVLLIVKNTSATSEIKNNSLSIKKREKWITIGTNDDPAHIHLNSELITKVEFIQEQKPERISFSIRFFDEKGERVFAVFLQKCMTKTKILNLKGKNCMRIYVKSMVL